MNTLLLSPPGAIMDVIQGLVMTLFVLSGLLLVVVVLLQEGKGGGIAGAFGGAGGETFGVKAGAVNRFTSYLGFGFLGLALLHAGIESKIQGPQNLNTTVQTPGEIENAGSAPKTPPSTPEGTPPSETPKDGTPPGGGEPPPGPAPTPAPAPAPEPAPAPAAPVVPPSETPAMGG